MSCIEIHAFDKDGNAYCYGKVKNSFRGAFAIWQALEERHLPPFIPDCIKKCRWYHSGMSREEIEKRAETKLSRLNFRLAKAANEIWQLVDNPSIPRHERIVLFTTLEDCLVKKENIEKVIEAFEQFEGDTNLPKQAEILRKIAEDDDIVAIGWVQNDVSCTGWDVAGGYDEEKDECNPYNCLTGNKHFWLFDELQS